MIGHAVSPVTSYVAAEPGTRPSPIGLAEGLGTIGSGRYGTIGYGSGSGMGAARYRPDLESLVDLAACVQSVHPAPKWRVALTIETTRDEIVDVTTSIPSPMASCLTEAYWAIRLDPLVFDGVRDAFDVSFGDEK